MSTDRKKKSSGPKKTESQEGQTKRKKSIIPKPSTVNPAAKTARQLTYAEDNELFELFFEELPKGFDVSKHNGLMIGGYVPPLIKELLKRNAKKNFRNMSQEILCGLTHYLENVLAEHVLREKKNE